MENLPPARGDQPQPGDQPAASARGDADDTSASRQSAGRTGTAGSSDWFTTEIVFDKSHADEDFGMLCRLLETGCTPL